MELNQIFFRPPPPTYSKSDFAGIDRYFEIPSEKISNKKKIPVQIPCVLMPYMLRKEMISKYYIVYFHGNAEDLGTSYDFLYDLRSAVRCNIILTEYSGYGLYSDGNANCAQIEYDSEKIFQFLTQTLCIPKYNIILLGRSMGSGPACRLASLYHPRGLMLISAFTSLKDVATNMVGFLSSFVCDRFRNIDCIEQVKCPVLLIHGKMDKLVPFQHSQRLADKLLANVQECYQDKMTHNDYDLDVDIIHNISTFFRDKMNIFQKKNDPILSKFESFSQEKFYCIYPEAKIESQIPQIIAAAQKQYLDSQNLQEDQINQTNVLPSENILQDDYYFCQANTEQKLDISQNPLEQFDAPLINVNELPSEESGKMYLSKIECSSLDIQIKASIIASYTGDQSIIELISISSSQISQPEDIQNKKIQNELLN